MTRLDPPPRVRVTAPRSQVRRRASRTAAPEINAHTEVGEIFVRSLVRAQLRAAAGTLATLGLVIGVLPLVFVYWPSVGRYELLGMPVAWVLLAFGIYPVLVFLGRWHVRRTERIEDAFADVVEGS